MVDVLGKAFLHTLHDGYTMGKTKYSCAEFIEAIKGSDGVKTIIARRLNVTRKTVNSYLARWVTARRAYEQEVAVASDMARSIIIDNMKLQRQQQRDTKKPADTADAKWWLRMKESDEFSEKQKREIAGADGEPITFRVVYEDEEEDEL